MKVNWKYDILFSFQVNYSQKLQPDDFYIVPANSCRQALKKYNLIFKPVNNGGLIISERKINDDNSKEPLWKIAQQTAFTFILSLKDQSLYSSLALFNPEAEDTLPATYGRKRLLYFDNLDESLEIDQNLIPVPDSGLKDVSLVSLDIAKNGDVSEQDYSSLVSNKFAYRKINGVSSIVLKPLRPTRNDKKTYYLTNQKPEVELELTTGAYQFEQVGSGRQKETIFACSELFGSSALAIIQIYKNETTDYNTAIRYNINFNET